jgi:hypothetical protein
MTQAQFNELPLLLPRKTFKSVTGLSDHEIDTLVHRRRLRVFRRPVRVYRRSGLVYKPRSSRRLYFKTEAARLGGFTL